MGESSRSKSVLQYKDMISSFKNNPLPRRRSVWARIDFTLIVLVVVGLGVWGGVMYLMMN